MKRMENDQDESGIPYKHTSLPALFAAQNFNGLPAILQLYPLCNSACLFLKENLVKLAAHSIQQRLIYLDGSCLAVTAFHMEGFIQPSLKINNIFVDVYFELKRVFFVSEK